LARDQNPARPRDLARLAKRRAAEVAIAIDSLTNQRAKQLGCYITR